MNTDDKYCSGSSLWSLRKFTKEVKIHDEVWVSPLEYSMCVKNIRVDANGRPIFDLLSYDGCTHYIARFEEILEIY